MESFITWKLLLTVSGLLGATYMVTEFTKGIKFIDKIPTRYWSFIVSFIITIAANIAVKQFAFTDLVLYALNSISISLGANGLYDFGDKTTKKIKIAAQDINNDNNGGY